MTIERRHDPDRGSRPSEQFCPYPGPRPFEATEEDLFFGREREVRELASLIIAHRAVLLYAQSAAGKTSLLKASLVPRLLKEGFEVLPPARVRGLVPESMPVDQIPNIYVFNALMSWAEETVRPESLVTGSLREFLGAREHPADKRGLPAPRVIIFDQFEELFTSYPEHWEKRGAFIQQLAEALDADRLLRALIVIREDYVGSLDSHAEILPERLRVRYRLERLRREAACMAVEGPLRGTGRSYGEGVAASLVEELVTVRGESGRTASGEYVEPVYLQVVCRDLWLDLPPEVTVITAEHRKIGDVDAALRAFYERALKATAAKTGLREGDLRAWFDSHLITAEGTRGTVFRGKERTGGIPNAAVLELENQLIVRAELRAGGHWYELTHDRLIGPIQKSNEAWREGVRASQARKRMRKRAAVVAPLLAVLVALGVWLGERRFEYHRRTEGQIERLRAMPEEERRQEAETVLNDVTMYLWVKGDRRLLVDLLRSAGQLIPEGYGQDPSIAYLAPSVDPGVTWWPLVLRYNDKLGLDQGRLQWEWRTTAAKLARQWGIVAPMRLQLETDDKIPASRMYVRAVTSISESPPGTAAPGMPVDIPLVPNHVVITEMGLPDQLRWFVDAYRQEWTPLALERGGPWWLVPRWSLPLWKVAGHPASPLEAVVAVTVANKLLENPDLVLTHGSVRYLIERVRDPAIERVRDPAPQTVEEALAARGGVDGIRRDLVELVRRTKYPLTHLVYILDAVAKYPGLSPSDLAERVVEDQQSPVERLPERLPGHRRPAVLDAKRTAEVASSEAYREAGAYLPPMEPPIRVYLGPDLETALAPGDKLTSEVLEALVELRGENYKRFGIIPPVVKFRTGAGTGLPRDALRIEILNQTEGDPDAAPVQVPPGQALEYLLGGLRTRYVELRTRWLTAEDVHSLLQVLPEDLRAWLEARYTLTDLKLLLRAVLAPRDANGDPAAWETLRHSSWLLGSLVFWTNVSDPWDGELIADHLRETQRARLTGIREKIGGGKAVELAGRGIGELEKGRVEAAAQLFREAAALDPQAARRAVLTLYPRQSQMVQAGQLKRLESRCRLPKPGDDLFGRWLAIRDRYELEEFLDQARAEISPEPRRTLQLCLLWSYFAERHLRKGTELLDQVLGQRHREQWTPNEEYLVARLILHAHGQQMTPPERLRQLEDLVSGAFKRWTDRDADPAFEALIRFYSETRPPMWYLTMLRSLVELRPQGYWPPYLLGAELARRGNEEDALRALDLLNRAERNLTKASPDELARRRAWLNWSRAQAYRVLAQAGDVHGREQAAKLLETLAETVRRHHDGWPAEDLIYSARARVLMLAGRTSEAVRMVEEGTRLFPKSLDLLFEKFFLHLAQLDTDAAVAVAQEALDRAHEDSGSLFVVALGGLLTDRGEFEYAARRFLATSHEYRDYIRMILYWSLRRQGKDREADDVLEERWRGIDRSTWSARLQHGDVFVWREMLIGYYVGKVARDEIFGPLKDRETFAPSPLSGVGLPLSEMGSEAYFYDALLQAVSGDRAGRRDRQLQGLERVLSWGCVLCYEHHMARYLIAKDKAS